MTIQTPIAGVDLKPALGHPWTWGMIVWFIRVINCVATNSITRNVRT